MPLVPRVFPLLLLLAFRALAAENGTEPLRTISRLAEVRRLSPTEAARHYPVAFDGTVLVWDCIPGQNYVDLFLHDGETGVYVLGAEPALKLQAGEHVRFRGRTCPGEFAPCVTPEMIEPLDIPPGFPDALPVTTAELASGAQDSQFVELHGVVRSVQSDNERFALHVASDGFRIRVKIADPLVSREQLERLIDAEIRVRGACYSLFTPRRQLFGVGVYARSLQFVSVVRPAPPDPFAVPARPVDALLQFAPDRGEPHRVKVSGAVTSAGPGNLLFIRDRSRGLMVQTAQPASVREGDRVEVVGFPAFHGYTAILEDGVCRRMDDGSSCAPRRITAREAVSGDWEAELVSIDGAVLEQSIGPGGQQFIVQTGDCAFHASLSASPPLRIENGTTARFTGICLASGELHYRNGEGWRPPSFQILLPSAASVTVLERPSWWTLRRILWLVAALVAVLIGAFAWAAALHRQVRAQTARIHRQVEREALLEERNRIAREIHDTLAQGFVGAAFQLEALEAELSGNTDALQQHLHHAKSMVRHGLAEARRSVVALRGMSAAAPAGLSQLRESLELLVSDSEARLEVRVQGPTVELPPLIESNLMRIAQEAVVNAVRHGSPRRIAVTLRRTTDAVFLEVADDGRGFDPESAARMPGHFGILGIQERAREMGGSVSLRSCPGDGCRLTVHAPYSLPASLPCRI